MTQHLHDIHPLEQLQRTRTQKLLKAVTSYYAFTLLIAAAFAYLFGWLADEVMEQEWFIPNSSILLRIHFYRSPVLDRLAFDITWLGSSGGIITLSVLVVAGLWMLRRYVDLGTYAAVMIGASVMVLTLKVLFHQARPQVFPPLVHESNYSFPSGHSLTSFAVWGFMAWWVVSIEPREAWRWVLGLLSLCVAALVALSRLYLGVHWPTDVLAGMFLAFGWVALCITGHRWLTRHARRERREQLHEAWLARRTSRSSPRSQTLHKESQPRPPVTLSGRQP